MKKLSDYKQRIADLSAKLPPITEKQKQWAMKHFFNPIAGLCNRGKVWCTNCGEIFKFDNPQLAIDLGVLKETVCPHCGCKLELKNSKETKYRESYYYTIMTTCKGFQVLRHFIVEKKIYKVPQSIDGCQKPIYSIREAVQHWIDQDARETIMARPTKSIPYIYDAWNFEKPLKIQQKSHWSAYNPDKFYINADTYPERNILPILKRNGYSGRFRRFAANELCKLLLKDNEAEMLIKTGQYELLDYKFRRSWGKLPHEHAIRIANRNKYIVKDASMWYDYLALLSYFHLDTHNAHYVCPSDLKGEHDKLMKRKQRVEAKIEYQKKLEESKEWEEHYRKSKGRFFGICFGNENIMITVIQSVAEMAEEGTFMRHCVYTNGYYKKENSLILSAKDMDGKRIETIEIDLNTFNIIQSRGFANGNTDRHEEVLQLVRANMNLIRKAA